MQLRGVNHVSFPVADLERSLAFYRDLLGLTPIPRPDFGSIDGAWLAAGDAQVHLIVTPEGSDIGTPPGGINPLARHAAFAIDDYDAAEAALAEAGHTAFGLGREQGQLFLQDPDGHMIELIVPRPAA